MSVASTAVGSTHVIDEIIALRHSPDRREELVALLAEQSPIYQGLSSGAAERIRGFVLASFEKVGVPEGAIPSILEELETGMNPYTVAAAARALRGATRIDDETFALLVAAAERIQGNDDGVQYDTIDPGDAGPRRTSALAEILRTIAASGPRPYRLWLKVDAMAVRGACEEAMLEIDRARRSLAEPSEEQCCCATKPAPLSLAPSAPPAGEAADCFSEDHLLQDQSGARFKYREFLAVRPSVVTFFYTRCMNSQKCSLTVTKLTGLQRRLGQLGFASRINICAFTYDPAYDQPARLLIYGRERGFRFDDQNRFIRTVGSFEPIRSKFNLGVGYGPATINQHAVELFIIGANGHMVREFRRVQWHDNEVIRAIQAVLDPAAVN